MKRYQGLLLTSTALVVGVSWGLAVDSPLKWVLLPLLVVIGFWAESIDRKLRGL